MRAVTRILCPVDLLDAYKAKITALHVRNPLVVPETDVETNRRGHDNQGILGIV